MTADGTTDLPCPRPARWWAYDLAFAAVLVGLVWAAYAPSLKHIHRADQWCYLGDTLDSHTFGELLAQTYSYNRTRTICAGDTELFRPVLFAVLAGEKAVLDTDFAAYQAVGIWL